MDGIRNFEVFYLNGYVLLAKMAWGLRICDDGKIFLDYAHSSSSGREYADLGVAVKEFNSKQLKTNFTIADIERYVKEAKGE